MPSSSYPTLTKLSPGYEVVAAAPLDAVVPGGAVQPVGGGGPDERRLRSFARLLVPVLGAMGEDVSGYIVKDDPFEEYVRAVRLVAQGGSCVSPRPNLRRNDSKPWDSFTDRDREMLRMVAEGRGDKEIGEAVYLAERTVKHRLGKMRRALGAENRTHLAVLTIKQKILRLPDD